MHPQYYIAKRGGTQTGPYHLAALKQMLATDPTAGDYVAWCEGMADWRPLAEVVAAAAATAVKTDYNLVSACVSCIKRYVQFSGRAGRSEYWWFMLAYHILYFSVVLFSILSMVAWPFVILMVLCLLAMLACLLPLIAVGFRRMQDVGHHGAFFFIPVYGAIILALRPSSQPNRYGNGPEPPKA